MPDFIAVQCFKCNHYQVAQRRKDSKFSCKLCNAKQSVRKVVAHSDRAADVRKFVQQINLARGRAEENFDEQNADGTTAEERDESGPCLSSAETADMPPARVPLSQSRWHSYSTVVTKRNRKPDPYECDDSSHEEDIVTALPDLENKARRRKRNRGSKLRNGPQENTSQNLRTAGPPTQNTSPKIGESLRNQNHDQYQWGAAPRRGNRNRSAAKDCSREVAASPGRSTYAWGRGIPRMNQSQGSAAPRPHGALNRWDVLASQRPHAPQSHAGSSFEVATAPESDGLLTTLGADEVVQDEVLY